MLKVNRSDFLIKPFLKRNNIRASYQIISTIIPNNFYLVNHLPNNKSTFFIIV